MNHQLGDNAQQDDPYLRRLLEKKLLFVTGKGGIGKTLVSAALAQYSAAQGKRVLLVQSNMTDQIGPLFGNDQGVGHEEVSLAPGISCINIEPQETFREYVVKYLGQKRLFDTVFSNRLVESFVKTIPGFGELMMLGRLYYTLELSPEREYDLIIFDCFASGHFLSLMTTPQAVLDAGIGGPLAKETRRIKDYLDDGTRTAILYVGVAEELVISESLEFLHLIQTKLQMNLAGFILNRYLPATVFPNLCGGKDSGLVQDFEHLANTLSGVSLPEVAGGPIDELAHPLAPVLLRQWKIMQAFTREACSQGYGALPVQIAKEFGMVKEPLAENFYASFFIS